MDGEVVCAFRLGLGSWCGISGRFKHEAVLVESGGGVDGGGGGGGECEGGCGGEGGFGLVFGTLGGGAASTSESLATPVSGVWQSVGTLGWNPMALLSAITLAGLGRW